MHSVQYAVHKYILIYMCSQDDWLFKWFITLAMKGNESLPGPTHFLSLKKLSRSRYLSLPQCVVYMDLQGNYPKHYMEAFP